MLAITSDEKSTQLFYDGALLVEIDSSVNPDDSLYLGMMPGNPLDIPFKGVMDDILVYNRKINAQEIKVIYNKKDIIPIYNGPNWYVVNTKNNKIQNGSKNFPFTSIQKAIDEARDGHNIFVDKGVYTENIKFLGEKIHLKSINGAKVTTIKGNEGAVVLFTKKKKISLRWIYYYRWN